MGHTMQEARGHSLIEIMMVLSIVAIGLGLAAPSFRDVAGNVRMSTAHNALMTALSQARSSAVMRGRTIGLCASLDGRQCNAGTAWQGGWIIFEDSNRNERPDGNEPLIAVGQAQSGVAIASTNGRKELTFQPDGSSPGSNVTFTLCDVRGVSRASAIVVSNSGRARRGVPDAAHAASACAQVYGG